MAEIFAICITIIEIQNWTNMWRRSIITPVSTILLQDNSLKPAESGLFFGSRWLAGQCARQAPGLRTVMAASH
jgi:hypothetical protein